MTCSLILAAVALGRKMHRPDNHFFARDIRQWWLHPDVPLLRDQGKAALRGRSIDMEAIPMMADLLGQLSERSRCELFNLLDEWANAGFPDRPPYPPLGFLVRRGISQVECTVGHHPVHQQFNGDSPFWMCRPTPIQHLGQLRRRRVEVPEYHDADE